MPSRPFIPAFVLAVAALLSACRPHVRRQTSDVVLIVIDTLRADHLPLYGYPRQTSPNLELLAADGVTYEHAITPGTWTVPSHASLFTGRWPSFHGAERVAADHNVALPLDAATPTLAELLHARGFHTAGFVGNSTYVAGIFGFARGFDEFFDHDLYAPPKLSRRFNQWLAPRREPLFVFVNILDPHEPYEPPPPLDTMFPTKHPELGTMMTTLVYGGAPVTPVMREHFTSQYDGEIVYADQALGDIVGGLRAADRYDDALVIVTSDHGEFLGEHGLAGHGVAPFEPELHVPLVVKYPRRERAGERVGGRVSTLGIFATALASAGVPLPSDIDARPLDEPQPVWVEDIDSNGTRIRVGYDGDEKLVTAVDAHGATKSWLYELAKDPEESAPIRSGDGAERLRETMATFSAAIRPVNTSSRPTIDPEREAKLRALGYVR